MFTDKMKSKGYAKNVSVFILDVPFYNFNPPKMLEIMPECVNEFENVCVNSDWRRSGL